MKAWTLISWKSNQLFCLMFADIISLQQDLDINPAVMHPTVVQQKSVPDSKRFEGVCVSNAGPEPRNQ